MTASPQMDQNEVVAKAKKSAKASTEQLQKVNFNPPLVEKAFELTFREGYLEGMRECIDRFKLKEQTSENTA